MTLIFFSYFSSYSAKLLKLTLLMFHVHRSLFFFLIHVLNIEKKYNITYYNIYIYIYKYIILTL